MELPCGDLPKMMARWRGKLLSSTIDGSKLWRHPIKMHLSILSYNHPDLTRRCIDSATQLISPSFISLIHNGSERRHIEALKSQYPKIEHLVIEKNIGYSGGANLALRNGFDQSEWVLFLTNDCEVLQLPNLPLRPTIVAPLIYKRKTNKIDSIGGGFDPAKGKLIHFRSIEEFADSKKLGWIPYLPGSSFLVHKDVFEVVGGLDTRLGTYWDDVDWSVRAQRQGYQIQANTDFKVLHKMGKTCRKNPLYSLYYFQRNRKWISWKYCPPSLKPKLAAHYVTDCLRLSVKLISTGRSTDLRFILRAMFH